MRVSRPLSILLALPLAIDGFQLSVKELNKATATQLDKTQWQFKKSTDDPYTYTLEAPKTKYSPALLGAMPAVASKEETREGDMRLTVYADVRDCSDLLGSGEDNNNLQWCPRLRGGMLQCRDLVEVNNSICPSGQAMLSTVYSADSTKHDSVAAPRGCKIGFLAQYICIEDVASTVSHIAISRVAPPKTPRGIWASRHHHHHPAETDRQVSNMFHPSFAVEWKFFVLSLPFFILLLHSMADWPSQTRFHAVGLLIWITVALLFNCMVFWRLGTETGVMWLTGYILELIFSIENVFVFHIVVKAFRTPRRQIQKGLIIVICCQIVFQLVFYMGLAAPLRQLKVLPYMLGIWLLYVGVEAARESGHAEFDVQELKVFKLFQTCLGERLSKRYHEDASVIFIKNDRWHCTLLAPVVCCLLIVDFLLEVDVTLTKIEELPMAYVAFTSSVLASFAVPELFFVARDLFQRFHLLKYGVCFVLVFFGLQMLGEELFTIPDLIGVAIMIGVMILCMFASTMIEDGSVHSGKGEREESDAEWSHGQGDSGFPDVNKADESTPGPVVKITS